jgi:drug/metabolite transporter (DMT)-like permease
MNDRGVSAFVGVVFVGFGAMIFMGSEHSPTTALGVFVVFVGLSVLGAATRKKG